MTFISWTDEFITSFIMSINGKWNYSSFHTELLLISAFTLLTHTDLFWLQHPSFCINIHLHFIKKRYTAIICVFAGQHGQPTSTWTRAKCSFPVSPAVIQYLVSWFRSLKGNNNSGCTTAVFAIGCRSWCANRPAPVQHPGLRATVLKCLSVLEQLCSHKWNHASRTYR